MSIPDRVSVLLRRRPGINTSGPSHPTLGTPCWLPAGNPAKYKTARLRGRQDYAHRVFYEAAHGPIPAGLEIDHLCRVRRCVNPSHLEAVTHRVNALRGVSLPAQNARKTHCPKGHQLAGRNVIRQKHRRGRKCRECAYERNRAYYHSHKPKEA